MKFIELTYVGGTKVMVNFDLVVIFEPVSGNTTRIIPMDGKPYMHVKESYDLIKHLLVRKVPESVD